MEIFLTDIKMAIDIPGLDSNCDNEVVASINLLNGRIKLSWLTANDQSHELKGHIKIKVLRSTREWWSEKWD